MKTSKIKTNELIGPALDWSVAKALGLRVYVENFGNVIPWTTKLLPCAGRGPLCYSTDWSQGGPIIKLEKIGTLWNDEDGLWNAYHGCGPMTLTQGHAWAIGPTPLIAAMRCYVAVKMGDEVESPFDIKPS